MKPIYRNALIVGLLATVGVAAFSKSDDSKYDQGMMGDHGQMMGMHGEHNMEKMQARWEKRTAQLKKQLKLTSAQEGAWTTFTSAMKPSMDKKMHGEGMEMADMAKLSTPERIEKMHAMRTQRMKEMSDRMGRHEEAVKTFYATLSPAQQKTFDAEFMNMANMKKMKMRGHDAKEKGEHDGY